MVRMWKLVFLGAPRSAHAGHAHEGGFTLTVPLVVLAILAVVGGYTTHEGTGLIYGQLFTGVLSQIPHAEGAGVYAMSLAILAVGAGLALVLYKSAATDTLAEKAPGLFAALGALRNFFDRAYDYYIAKIQQRFAMLLNFLEQIFLAGLIVRGLAGVVGLFGMGARALHVGNLNAYVYWFLFGAVILWAFATGVLSF
jgi:NADH-quinone oxidoreductase subunit L